MPEQKKPTRSSAASAFTAEEKVAMKELVKERKANANKADAEADAIKTLTAADEAKIAKLLKKAVS